MAKSIGPKKFETCGPSRHAGYRLNPRWARYASKTIFFAGLHAATIVPDSPALGKTIVDSGELGVNYWHSKRFRATFNYVVNHFGQGSAANATLGALTSPWEQEFLFRLAVAL